MLRSPADHYRTAGVDDVYRRQAMAQALAPAMDAAAQHSPLAAIAFGALGGYQQRKLMDAARQMERQAEIQEQEKRKMIAEAIASGDVKQAAIATGEPSLLKMAFEESGDPLPLSALSSFSGIYTPESIVEAERANDTSLLKAKPQVDPLVEFEAKERIRAQYKTPSPGQTITINVPDGNQELSTANVNKEQEAVIAGLNQLDQLESALGSYADEYLTFAGKAKQTALAFGEKAGIELGEESKKYLSGATEFFGRVESFFNAYRKEITGAAAAEKELAALKKATINGDLSPTEFKARASALIGDLRTRLESGKQRLREGVRVAPDEEDDDALIGKYLD